MTNFLTRLLIAASIIGLIGAGWMVSHSQARSSKYGYAIQAQRPHDAHSVLVKLATGVDSPLKQTPGVRHLFGDWYQIPVSADKTPTEAMDALAQREDVITVELNYLVHLDDVEAVPLDVAPQRTNSYPDDPIYGYQWHLPQVQSDAAWNISRGANVTVAVVDSGVSRGDDLACRTFVAPYSAITDTPGETAAKDQQGHGTHVAGTIGQCTNNNKGVAGMAPNVKLMPVRVLDAAGNGTMADVATGINWAVDHGAGIINLSLGMECNGATWPSCSQSLINDAIDKATNHDVLIVAAAGNSSGSTPYFPANHPDVIAVAAVDYNQQRTWYSNRGDALTISAPGGDTDQDANHDGYVDGVLQQTFDEGNWGYYFYQGTSMASPHVAGAAALPRSYVPNATREQVKEALIHTAKDLGDPGFDNLYGYGLLQTADALIYLRNNQSTPTPTPTSTPTATPGATPVTGRTTYLPIILRSWPRPTATPTTTPTATPTATPSGPTGIYGRITYNNVPRSDVKLTLRRYKGTDETTIATTYTDKQGRYSFKGASSLPSGYTYYVRFGPNATNDDYMYVWYGPDIKSYHSGDVVHGGDFDIADTRPLSPPNQATRSLPVTFTWDKRAYSADTYRYLLFDVDTDKSWLTDDLGNTGSVTITGLPSDVQRNKAYGWNPVVYNGSDSFGFPYYYRLITFSASANEITTELAPASQLGVSPKALLPAPFEEP